MSVGGVVFKLGYFLVPPFEKGGTTVRGFTLVELVLIIIIAGAIFAIATPDTPGFAVELRAQAEQLASDIRYTQSLSMHRGARYRINFFSNYYTITDLAGTTPVPNPSNNTTQMNLQSGTTMTLTTIPNGYLVFDGRGAPYTDTGSTLGGGGITLTRGTETQAIAVISLTGAVIMNGGT